MSIRKLSFPTWTTPIALLLLCLVSYGLLAGRLGYYWDDWPAIWFQQTYGASSLIDVLGIDRPQLAWLYILTTSLVGQSMLGWQIFAILMRWLSCLALWWMLKQIWPERRIEITWVTFLFAIYPGFRQQYIALIYSHDWIVIGLFFVSMGLMVAAMRQTRWFWAMLAASWLLTAFAMFADEYYFGLELLRPVFLWLALSDRMPERRARLRKVILVWLPYVLLMVVFLYWRLVLHVSPRGEVQLSEQIKEQPLSGLVNLVKVIALDVWESGLYAWHLPLRFNDIINSGLTSIYVYVALGLLVAGAVFVYLYRLQPLEMQVNHKWGLEAALIGLLALFLGGWPFWATGWQIGLSFPWDRFNLAMNLGASMLVAGLATLILRKRLLIVLVLGLLIGASSANAYHLAKYYQQDWELLRQFFWQMSWRVPGIQENTVLLTWRPPFTYATDNSLTAPLNWIYAPEDRLEDRLADRSLSLPYLFWDVASHHPEMGWNDLDPNQPLIQDYRITRFEGSFGQALSIFYKPPNCVKVLDAVLDAELPGRPLYITPAVPFSRSSLILANPERPAYLPPEIFGQEPEPDWCYYFEKAELARQTGDWQTTALMADKALAIGKKMSEANVVEWMPFIEGYLNTDRIEEAENLSLAVYQEHPKMRRMLCAAWDRAAGSGATSPAYDEALKRLDGVLACSARD